MITLRSTLLSTIARALLRPSHSVPHHPRRQGSGQAAAAVLTLQGSVGEGSASFSPLSMAISTAARCEIRALVMHVYPDGIKAYGHERHTVYIGRRRKTVPKLRSMPEALALELARKLQGRFATTVSVV